MLYSNEGRRLIDKLLQAIGEVCEWRDALPEEKSDNSVAEYR